MKREILFRGKRLDNGEWVYGAIICQDDRYFINPQTDGIVYCSSVKGKWIFGDYLEVDPATVGQYTGMTDKNGKKIFEGDVIKGLRYHDYGKSGEYQDDVRIAKWREKDAGFYPFTMFDGYTYNLKHYAVIGNIYDNPELLEGEK